MSSSLTSTVILAVNSGNTTDSIFSPKLSLIFGPWASTELYLNGGFGFHSNDARGTTITVDPKTGDPAQRWTPWCGRKAPKSACAVPGFPV